MNRQKSGSARLLLVLLVPLVLVFATLLFLFKDKLNLPSISSKEGAEPKVAVVKGNRNPFAKESQYVNPFDESKSPFANFEVAGEQTEQPKK